MPKLGVIGGGGHVGLPLAISFAKSGLPTYIQDIDAERVATIQSGEMPFYERDAELLLKRTIQDGSLSAGTSPAPLSECDFIVVVIGTPVDEHLNPGLNTMRQALDECREYLRDGQILILRSTIFPGISEHTQRYLRESGLDIRVSFCPERIAQGNSLQEFRELPQIVSAFDDHTLAAVRSLFERISSKFIEMTPMEAELCKLMTNAWRYVQFATVNQFYMIATEQGVDFERILHGCRTDYPRMRDMPGPGFAAGPCLVKDTMQLAAFSQDRFVLGHAAMIVNEGLPSHLVRLAKRERDLRNARTGILGMAFKAGSDDPRDSLSYKLRKLLQVESKQVLCHDPLVQDESLVPLDRVVAESDVIFVATPHAEYRELEIPDDKLVVDVWGCVGAAS